MSIDRDIAENIGAEHQGVNGYTGDYRWGSSLYSSPTQCLEGVLDFWLHEVSSDEELGESDAREFVDMYGDVNGLEGEHFDRIVEVMNDVNANDRSAA